MNELNEMVNTNEVTVVDDAKKGLSKKAVAGIAGGTGVAIGGLAGWIVRGIFFKRHLKELVDEAVDDRLDGEFESYEETEETTEPETKEADK